MKAAPFRSGARRFGCIACVLAGLVLPAGALQQGALGEGIQAASSGQSLLDGLERTETIHFTLYCDYEDEDYNARLLQALEKNFSRLQKEFWDFIPPGHREGRVEVIVFQDAQGFDEFARKESGVTHGPKGYLSSRGSRMAILRQDAFHKDLTIAVHELVHVFNSWCAVHTPVWLDEGMAQFYSYFAAEEAGNESIRDGVNEAALARVDAALAAGRLPRAGTLIRMEEEGFYGPFSEVNFASAWALVYYLRRGIPAEGDALFSRFYAIIARGGDPYRAFTGSYGANMELIQRFWLAYLERLYDDNRDLLESGSPDEESESGVQGGEAAF